MSSDGRVKREPMWETPTAAAASDAETIVVWDDPPTPEAVWEMPRASDVRKAAGANAADAAGVMASAAAPPGDPASAATAEAPDAYERAAERMLRGAALWDGDGGAEEEEEEESGAAAHGEERGGYEQRCAARLRALLRNMYRVSRRMGADGEITPESAVVLADETGVALGPEVKAQLVRNIMDRPEYAVSLHARVAEAARAVGPGDRTRVLTHRPLLTATQFVDLCRVPQRDHERACVRGRHCVARRRPRSTDEPGLCLREFVPPEWDAPEAFPRERPARACVICYMVDLEYVKLGAASGALEMLPDGGRGDAMSAESRHALRAFLGRQGECERQLWTNLFNVPDGFHARYALHGTADPPTAGEAPLADDGVTEPILAYRDKWFVWTTDPDMHCPALHPRAELFFR